LDIFDQNRVRWVGRVNPSAMTLATMQASGGQPFCTIDSPSPNALRLSRGQNREVLGLEIKTTDARALAREMYYGE